MGMEDDVRNVADAELHAIVPLQRLALYPFAVDESSVLAALVHDAELPVFGGDQSVVAGDARIGDHQILIDFASHGERSVVEIDGALVVPLHEHQGGKYSRAGGRNGARDGLKSHGRLYPLLRSNNGSSTDGASSVNAKPRRLPCLADLLSRSTC